MSRDASAVADRVTRALDEFFHVETTSDPDKFRVHSGSGDTYTVTLTDGTCTCPDGQRGPWCKHAHRVLFEHGELPPVVGSGVMTTDDHAEPADDPESDETGDNNDDEPDTLTARVERFEANNPGASAIEAISQLGIHPDKKERVEEVLA